MKIMSLATLKCAGYLYFQRTYSQCSLQITILLIRLAFNLHNTLYFTLDNTLYNDWFPALYSELYRVNYSAFCALETSLLMVACYCAGSSYMQTSIFCAAAVKEAQLDFAKLICLWNHHLREGNDLWPDRKKLNAVISVWLFNFQIQPAYVNSAHVKSELHRNINLRANQLIKTQHTQSSCFGASPLRCTVRGRKIGCM